MASPSEIAAALEVARRAGNAQHVAILEAALRQPGPVERSLGMGEQQEATGPRAVSRGLENVALWGFSPEARAIAYGATRTTPSEETELRRRAALGPFGMQREDLAVAAGGQRGGPAPERIPAGTRPMPGLTMLTTQAGAEELAREKELQRRLWEEHPWIYGGAQMAVPAGVAALKRVGPSLLKRAGRVALRDMNVPNDVRKIADRFGLDQPEKVGAYLAEGRAARYGEAPVGQAVNRRTELEALRKAQDALGTQLEAVAKAAQGKARVDVADVSRRFGQTYGAEAALDPTRGKMAESIQAYLIEKAQRAGRYLTPENAWKWRRNLDDELYGLFGQMDPEGKLSASARLATRRAVDSSLGDAMQSAGLGAEWSRLNPEFGVAKDAAEVAYSANLSDVAKEASARGLRMPLVVNPSGRFSGRAYIRPMGSGFMANQRIATYQNLGKLADDIVRGFTPEAMRAHKVRSLVSLMRSHAGPEEE